MKSTAFCFLFLCSCNSFAQAQPDLFDLSIDQLLELEIAIASKRHESFAKSPGVISVLTREDIKTYGAKSLHDLMRLIPGFQPVHPQLHHNNSVAVRGQIAGANDKFFLILLNGKPIRDPILYGVNAPLYTGIPISAIERIEVIRGPGSIVYGSNAFAGVMNIQTKEADDDAEIQLSHQYGSYNTNTSELVLTNVFNNELKLTVAARTFHSHGWELGFVDTSGLQDSFYNRTDGYGAFLELDYKGFNLNWFKSDLEEIGTVASGIVAEATERPSDREFFSFTYDGEFGDDWLYRASFSSSASSIASLTEVDAKDENIDFTLHKSYQQLSLDFGLSSRTNRLKKGIYAKRTSIDYHSAYAQIGYEFSSKFNLIGGLNLLSPFDSDNLLSPRFALLGQFNQYSGYKLIYGTAYNSPTGLEQNLLIPNLFFGNPDLKPSTITNLDGQVYFADETRFLSLSLFSSKHEDLIDLVDVTPGVPLPKQYKNLPEAKYTGLELEGQYQLADSWRLVGSYNLQQPDNNNQTSNKGVLSETMIKLGLTYQPSERLHAAVHNVWYSQVDNRTGLTDQSNPATEDYSLLTVNINYRFEQVTQFIEAAELNFFIDNALHQDPIFLPDLVLSNLNTMPKIAGRAYYLGINLRF